MVGNGSCETRLKRGQQTAPQYASIRLCYGFPVFNRNTLQHTHTQLRYAYVMVFRYHTATYCNTLQHTATRCNTMQFRYASVMVSRDHTATHCNMLQHTATLICLCFGFLVSYCNTLQHTHATPIRLCYGFPVSYCHILPYTATRCNTMQLRCASVMVSRDHTATHCDTLRHTARNCNFDTLLLRCAYKRGSWTQGRNLLKYAALLPCVYM